MQNLEGMGEAQHIAGHHDNIGAVGRREHLIGSSKVQRDGFFGENMNPGLGAADDYIDALEGRRADHHAVYMR